MSGTQKYSEQIVRYPARTHDGRPCEILERITLEHEVVDGRLGEPRVFTRRFDLRTGERLRRLSESEFEIDDGSGARLHLQPDPAGTP